MNEETVEEIEEIKVRRVFISYSWTNNDYVEGVRDLAEELASHGMDVELDQWSLKEGDDKFVYMESMVNDPTIDKVLILLDRKYKEKADGREGGVGNEATIMTPKVYADVVEKRGKQKFIPVIMERDLETGKEFVPAFLDGRKYVDLSNSERYAERFEELVRAIHNKPLHRKPLPGKIPGYLLESEAAQTGTAGRCRRATEFLASNNSQALNAVKDYFSLVIESLRVFDFPSATGTINYEAVIGKIQELAPIRDEVVDCFVAIARYGEDPAFYEEVRRFFENLLPYFEFRNQGDSNNQWAADHYKFLGHELFLYAIAASLKFQRFSQLNELTEQGYFSVGNGYVYSPAQNTLLPFLKFCTYSEALDRYNRAQARQYQSYDAYLFHHRATRQDVTFESLMQADFFLYMLYEIDEATGTPSGFIQWYPVTLMYAEHRYNSFEIFSRSQSTRFFDRLRISLRNVNKEFLVDLLNKISSDKEHSYHSFRRRLSTFAQVDLLATRP